MSAGLTVKLIAREGSKVQFANGGESKDSWHTRSDAAGILKMPDGGYVYMSNSEESDGDGGVYGLYFNAKGEIVDYRALLTGTTDNCGGGITPWNTWVSVSLCLCVLFEMILPIFTHTDCSHHMRHFLFPSSY